MNSERPASTPPALDQASLCRALSARFGDLMTTEEVCETLKFRTASALRMARKRGHIVLQPRRMSGRKRHFFVTEEVAVALIKGTQTPAPSQIPSFDDRTEENAM